MRYVCLLLVLMTAGPLKAQIWKDFRFESGDLLFQDLDCGELCEAIETVTPALGNKHFSHIGMAYVAGDSVYVIEAIGKDVHLVSIHQFLQRQLDTAGQPKVVVGRLKKQFRRLNGRALGFALQQKGMLYDETYIYNNGKYYCSELVYEAYKEANEGRPFFHLYPMTFQDPKTKRTFPAWKKYYKELKMDVPEGKQGCNPGGIAISDNVEIVAAFY